MGWVCVVGGGEREGRSCRIPLVKFCLHVPEGHAFWGRKPGCATTAFPRLSAPNSWRDIAIASPSLQQKQKGDSADPSCCGPYRSFCREVAEEGSHVYRSGSSTMLRAVQLRSCRLSSRAHLSRRAYNVSASSDAEAFLKPVGSSHPGVTCLSLNRPKTKNAISVTLLQVLCSSIHTYETPSSSITNLLVGVAIPELPRTSPLRQGVSPHLPNPTLRLPS